VNYLPAESDTGMFGGNSNWRGPVWMPVNVLLIRALLSFYLYYGDTFLSSQHHQLLAGEIWSKRNALPHSTIARRRFQLLAAPGANHSGGPEHA